MEMKKLTKLQRYTVYCFLLEEAENPQRIEWWCHMEWGSILTTSQGFCRMCDMIFGQEESDYWDPCLWTPFDMLAILPELKRKRTTQIDDVFLFENWEQRIEALKQCIIETHPK